MHETLTADERERAARFHFEKHRRRVIVARGILRSIIARYFGIDAWRDPGISTYSAKGKPALAEPKIEDFGFNLSHSGDLALYAFAPGAPIGVDVEIIRPVDEMDAIAKRFFSPLEYDMLQRVPPVDQIEAFFCCWTRKEAYIKAEGLGFWIPLDSFAVSVAPSGTRPVHTTESGFFKGRCVGSSSFKAGPRCCRSRSHSGCGPQSCHIAALIPR